jgi:hypothetical protein
MFFNLLASPVYALTLIATHEYLQPTSDLPCSRLSTELPSSEPVELQRVILRLLEPSNHGGLSLNKFVDDKVPRYAILSHTWRTDGQEITFKDLLESKAGYTKIRFCGEQAASDRLQYFWVDTCWSDQHGRTALLSAPYGQGSRLMCARKVVRRYRKVNCGLAIED